MRWVPDASPRGRTPSSVSTSGRRVRAAAGGSGAVERDSVSARWVTNTSDATPVAARISTDSSPIVSQPRRSTSATFTTFLPWPSSYARSGNDSEIGFDRPGRGRDDRHEGHRHADRGCQDGTRDGPDRGIVLAHPRRDAAQHERERDQGHRLDEDLRERQVGCAARGEQQHHAQARDRDEHDPRVALLRAHRDEACRDHDRRDDELHRASGRRPAAPATRCRPAAPCPRRPRTRRRSCRRTPGGSLAG